VGEASADGTGLLVAEVEGEVCDGASARCARFERDAARNGTHRHTAQGQADDEGREGRGSGRVVGVDTEWYARV
jgi:hypothetical protein